ncbi:7-deoxyloganetic acid glucosyltransferase [Spatholobus suberectus]|nr:7-deoxyloganetic acid glucosyltransferase [Spatholobus suberectus]
MAGAHVLVFPCPLPGHVGSMLTLTELLALHHLHVTFLTTEYIHNRLTRFGDIQAPSADSRHATLHFISRPFLIAVTRASTPDSETVMEYSEALQLTWLLSYAYHTFTFEASVLVVSGLISVFQSSSSAKNFPLEINSRFVSEVWKLGLDMKDVCDRHVVEKMVNDLMVHRREEFLRSAQAMAMLAHKSVSSGGSSYTSLDDLIQYIKSASQENN